MDKKTATQLLIQVARLAQAKGGIFGLEDAAQVLLAIKTMDETPDQGAEPVPSTYNAALGGDSTPNNPTVA